MAKELKFERTVVRVDPGERVKTAKLWEVLTAGTGVQTFIMHALRLEIPADYRLLYRCNERSSHQTHGTGIGNERDKEIRFDRTFSVKQHLSFTPDLRVRICCKTDRCEPGYQEVRALLYRHSDMVISFSTLFFPFDQCF